MRENVGSSKRRAHPLPLDYADGRTIAASRKRRERSQPTTIYRRLLRCRRTRRHSYRRTAHHLQTILLRQSRRH